MDAHEWRAKQTNYTRTDGDGGAKLFRKMDHIIMEHALVEGELKNAAKHSGGCVQLHYELNWLGFA